MLQPSVTGINHITIAVKDLETSFSFYSDILGLKPLAKWPQGAYLLAGDLWFCLAVDLETRKGPLPEYTHFAFSVLECHFETMRKRIEASGAKIWKKNVSPGESLYFLDPDGHKLEVHVSDWRTRLQIAKNEKWEDMEFFI